jgi:hypothetical protein
MIYNTTLAAACGLDDEQVIVSNPAGIQVLSPNKTNPTYLSVDSSVYFEYMLVDEGYEEGSSIVPVVRGFNGTIGVAHAAGVPVQISDYISSGPFVFD